MQQALNSFALACIAVLSACASTGPGTESSSGTRPILSAPVPGPAAPIPGYISDILRTQDVLIFHVPNEGGKPLYVIRNATDAMVQQNAEKICRLNGEPTGSIRTAEKVLNHGKAKPRLVGVKCQ